MDPCSGGGCSFGAAFKDFRGGNLPNAKVFCGAIGCIGADGRAPVGKFCCFALEAKLWSAGGMCLFWLLIADVC